MAAIGVLSVDTEVPRLSAEGVGAPEGFKDSDQDGLVRHGLARELA